MAAKQALAMLGLLAIFSQLAGAAEECGYRKYQCKTSACIDSNSRCDGEKDCADGSDEDDEMCDKAPTVHLPEGNRVTARVQYKQEHSMVEFHLCAARCSVVQVQGSAPDGALAHQTYVDNNQRGDFGLKAHTVSPAGAEDLAPGELVFEVERRAREMALWLKGHPDKAASVPAEGLGYLRIKPKYWSTDMEVQFEGAVGSCGYRKFRCNDTECISANKRCNGRLQCSDKSDEDPDMCRKVPKTTLGVGENVTARVQYKDEEHSSIAFQLCDNTTCSVILASASSADGSLRYVAFVKNNARGDYGNKRSTGTPLGAIDFAPGELVFEVGRRDQELLVWLQGHPDKAASVPAEGLSVLRVRPFYWTTDMPVSFESGASALGVADTCGPEQLRCDNGTCIDASQTCTGAIQCGQKGAAACGGDSKSSEELMVTVSEVTDHSMLLSWAPSSQTTGTVWVYYQCQFRLTWPKNCGGGGGMSVSNDGRHELNNLQAGTQYTIEVRRDLGSKSQVHNITAATLPEAVCDGFKCDGHRCIDISKRCDGVKSCDDGSDEDTVACGRAPSTNLKFGEEVAVKVQYHEDNENILFAVCDTRGAADSCSGVLVKGANADGSLWFDSFTGCYEHASGCLYDHASGPGHFDDPVYPKFKTGNYTFQVQRRPLELALWLQGHYDKLMRVPASGGRLEVLPEKRSSIMPVEYVRHVEAHYGVAGCSDTQFTCGSGQCIELLEKCSGTRECEDGSDETVCDNIPQTNMSTGDILSVRVQFRDEFLGIAFLLCDSTTCSRITVTGSSADGALSYSAFTGCNDLGGNWCRQVSSVQPKAGKQFTAGVVAFEVQRRQSQLAVWLLGHADNKATVPVWRGSNRLRVRPHRWTANMTVEFDGPHCGSAPLSPWALTVNGDEAQLGYFPWHAAIYFKKSESEHTFVCGGSLVTRTVVISVAHCFFWKGKRQPADKYAVALGKVYNEWDHDEAATVFQSNVKRFTIHSSYEGIGRFYGADVALLELEQSVELSDYIQPICVNEELQLNSGEKFMVVGWGGELPRLESAFFKFQSFSECLDAVRKVPHEINYITTDKFCSLRETGNVGETKGPAGLAGGDSGGGAVAKRGDRWFLVGLVSVRLNTSSIYGFTDMSQHYQWTARTIERDFSNRVVEAPLSPRPLGAPPQRPVDEPKRPLQGPAVDALKRPEAPEDPLKTPEALLVSERPVDPPKRPVDPPKRPVDPPKRPVDPTKRPVDPPKPPKDPPTTPSNAPKRPVDSPKRPVKKPMRPSDVEEIYFPSY